VLRCTIPTANTATAGIPIGLVLTLCHLVGIPIDGTSVNPARSIGPAVLVGGWAMAQLWLFIVMPVIGAVIGYALNRLLTTPETAVSISRLEEAEIERVREKVIEHPEL
jgi:aquaporin Z